MIRHTFCHLPGVGPVREKGLWNRGYTSWEECRKRPPFSPASRAMKQLLVALDASFEALERPDPAWFADRLSPGESWRLYGDFRDAIAYLDIETSSGGGGISAISVSDGATVSSYVSGINLDRFAADIGDYSLLVTFNGTCFDLPVIRACLHTDLPQAHIDLRFALRSIGVRGGLKRAEKQFGVHRGMLDGIDGSAAVWLWDRYLHAGDERALETLLSYNTEDVRYLPLLLTACYNRRAAQTPFGHRLALPVPPLVDNPYRPDQALIDELAAFHAAGVPVHRLTQHFSAVTIQ